MFREHARLFSLLQFITDTLLTCAAFPLAYYARVYIPVVIPPELERYLNPALHPPQAYWWVIGLAVIWWAVTAISLGLYRISIRRSDWDKVRIVFECAILTGLFLGFLSFALKLDLSRPLIAFFISFQALLLSLERMGISLHGARKKHDRASEYRRNILIIGNGKKAREMGALISKYSDWGFRILGYVEINGQGTTDAGVDMLGSVSELPNIIENNVIDEMIFVGNQAKDLDSLDDILALCKEQGIHTRVALDFFPAKISKVSMEFLESVPVVSFTAAPDHAFSLFAKRVMDIVISGLCLTGLFPFMIFIGILVKMTSKGSVIYRQVRCGLYGRKFVLYKFRSMHEGAEDVLWEIRHLNEMDGPVFKMRNDPRVTPLGHFLRKSSIDEWPQFWNVFKGDMSLVGPRAPLPDEVREYSRWQRRRLSVKPGITCLWQVSGRNEIDFHEWMKLDLHYIDNWSLLLDIKILLRTFPVVLLGRGAR
jgi:exopolysaccharide biosynthesis polyprenyl glycosylphosphotransferase